MDAKKTGALIARLREKKDLTQEALAGQLGVTRKAISRWETGRGYPDVEILPALAEALGVSVNELLSGEERKPQPVTAVPKQPAVNWALWIIIGWACLVGGYYLFSICCLALKADDFRGSKNCVIAEDYSTITYLGEVYVPLDMGEYQCRVGEALVEEAYVEGMPLIVKYFFGDRVYEVLSVTDGSIIYLETDYDFPPSEYYVRQTQKEQMEQILADFTDAYTYAVITQKDWTEREVLMEAGVPEYLPAALEDQECGMRGQDDCVLPVIIYESNRIFYRMPGCIWYVGGEYYWHDGEDRYRNNHGEVYPIVDAWDPVLDTLAGYMHQ